ncbi:MAG: hypothetical protein ACD_47C00324G0001 [uncultured bacterium]|nr:MAG: hypothetical protein ACD_47C00324G0001 [uncultured bacterium]
MNARYTSFSEAFNIFISRRLMPGLSILKLVTINSRARSVFSPEPNSATSSAILLSNNSFPVV